MRKYISVFKATLNDELQYVYEIFTKFVGYIIMIYIFINLWQYIYEDPNQIINGFTYNTMIWYVIIAESFYTGMKNKSLLRNIKEDISYGNIAYKINKPYSYPIYSIMQYIGKIFLKNIVLIFIATSLGILFVGKLETFNIIYLPLNLIVIAFAYLINILWRITLSFLAFWVEDPTPFSWIYDKMILMFGTIFPVDMYPVIMQFIIKITPIYSVVYGPTRLLVNFDFEIFKEVLINQIIQLLFIAICCKIVYKKGEKKVNVNGG